MSRYVAGTFFDPRHAIESIDKLLALGYARRDIDVVMRPETRSRFSSDALPGEQRAEHVADNAAKSGAIGGAVGGIVVGLAAVAATGGAALPFIAGPILAAVAGIGVGATAGTFISLAGAGEAPDSVERDLDEGAIMIGLSAHDKDLPAVYPILNHPEDAERAIDLDAEATIKNSL